MRSVEVSARSVDEAIDEALRELGATREQVNVEVLEEGTKGFLGILGARQAKVRVTLRDLLAEKAEVAREFLAGILERMQVEADIVANTHDDMIELVLSGPNMGLLIGRRGTTLNSLQYLVNLRVNRNGEWNRVVLDAEGYRARREETLQRLARKVGARVKRTGKRAVLEPMGPHERRIIHMTLQDDAQLSTHSEGNEPYRRVVITAKRAR